MKYNKCHTVETVSQSNRNIGEFDTLNTHIHIRSLLWLDTSINSHQLTYILYYCKTKYTSSEYTFL